MKNNPDNLRECGKHNILMLLAKKIDENLYHINIWGQNNKIEDDNFYYYVQQINKIKEILELYAEDNMVYDDEHISRTNII